MVVRLQPLEFTDCVTDSPFFRDNLHAHERELQKTSQQIKRLIKEVKDLINAAKHLSRAQRSLSVSLQNFSFECIGTTQTDDELVITKSLAEFGRLIAAIEDERDRMLDRAYEQIIMPLENFRKDHIGGVKEGRKKFEKQTAKFCQSQERYLNLSTKKQDSVLQEADATLEMEQRHFCQASLEYVFLLQEVQERKKFEFVETLLSFMFGWLTFYHQGHEVAEDFKPYMRELQLRIQKTRENFDATRDKTESLMKKMLELRQMKPTDPVKSSKTYTREGYLYLLEKKALIGTTFWTKHYCMYERDTKQFMLIPYNQMTGKSNTSEKITVSSCTRRMSDSIDKRFCFDITSDDRPGIVYTFQALSEEDRKLWMDAMDGKEPTYGVPVVNKMPKPEERYLDEVGFAFVNKCIEVLESRGLDEQGLYRVVGVSSKVSKLLSMGLDRRKGEKLCLEDSQEWESKTITSALKTYLRNLHEPLMTFKYHNSFILAAKQETRTNRINEVHFLLHKVPQQNFNMLDILIKHLTNVVAHSDKNLMTVSNLGVCFGPTLLRPEEETVAAIMDIKFCNIVVEILIENYHKVFKTLPEIERSESVESSPQNHSNTRSSPPPSTPSPAPPMVHARHKQIVQNAPSLTHAVITRTYCDGPMLSASLHNVATATNNSSSSAPSSRDRADSYASMLTHSVDRDNYVSVALPLQTKVYHSQSRPMLNRAPASGVCAGMPAYSETNIHNLRNSSAYNVNSHHFNKSITHPSQQPPAPPPMYYTPPLSSENLNSTSSSNESVASLSSRDINNHNNYNDRIPQKNKRSSAMGIHYASSYKPYDSVVSVAASPVISGRTSPVYTSNIRQVRTLYACLGENDGELSFEPNQIITNVRSSMEPGWLEGTLNGKTGLVPENYVEILP
ncbi:rho GTPase-activating protein 26 isoform X2 [Planococcus citri]|uniref:rho GTPase-activating protein 26 isoform X2 n=1 Tax=Planococcus citri TaxID=170843 RepID=UPI0031F8DDED